VISKASVSYTSAQFSQPSVEYSMISCLEVENVARREHGTESTQSVKVHWKDKPIK
jgi:hypothetical protein